MSRRIGEPCPASWPNESGAVSAWASKWTMPMLPGRRTSATALALGQVIEWSPPKHDRDRAGRRDLADLAEDHRVAAVEPRRDDVRVARVDDRQLLERPDVELERVEAARAVLRLADRARPEAGARPVRDHVVERRPDDRDVDACRASSSAGSVTQGRFENVDGPTYVGRSKSS